MVTSYLSVRGTTSIKRFFFDDHREESTIRAYNQARDYQMRHGGKVAVARRPRCQYTESVKQAFKLMPTILESCPEGEHLFQRPPEGKKHVPACIRCGASKTSVQGMFLVDVD